MNPLEYKIEKKLTVKLYSNLTKITSYIHFVCLDRVNENCKLGFSVKKLLKFT